MRRRVLNGLGLLACAAMLAYAWYAQVVLGLEPCPLCIFQRIGIGACAVLFLLATLQNPARIGARIYGAALLLAALATMLVAGRHLWIQHLPEGSVPACGASLSSLLEVFPLTDVVRKVLGLSMPGWVLIAAAGLAGLASYANFPAGRRP